MFNKIAVVLRGQVRSWHYINQIIFKEFSNISKSVDYYFVTWYSPNLDVDKIIKSFHGQSLKKFVHVVPDQHVIDAERPSYLSSHVLDNIMAENYDAIIDTRPDVITFMTSDFKPYVDDNTVITAWNNVLYKPTGRLQMDDIFQIMKTDVFKIFCNFHKIGLRSTWDPHADLQDRYRLNRVKFVNIDRNPMFDHGFGNSVVVKPNILENIIKKDFDRWKLGHQGWLHLNARAAEWRELTSEEKRNQILKYSNMLPEDYDV